MRISDWSSDACSSDLRHHCEIRRSTLGDIKSVFIASAARTAIGDFGGGLAKKSPAELGVAATKAALERAGVAPTDVQHVFMGQVIPTRPKDAYLARVIALNAGIPAEAPALTLNRSEEHKSEIKSLIRISYSVY